VFATSADLLGLLRDHRALAVMCDVAFTGLKTVTYKLDRLDGGLVALAGLAAPTRRDWRLDHRGQTVLNNLEAMWVSRLRAIPKPWSSPVHGR
jgi:hypothetical protein